ncbi:hypothetical protein DFH06DRAFT_1141836 [Mycena polygramma]|nr:hypothetical protein DFH06DRAFT_1141836 [Mycena polygramma]
MQGTDLKPHSIHKESNISEFDVFIAGSGPIGATFARCLVDAGYSRYSHPRGAQEKRDRIPKGHRSLCKAALSVVSIPPSESIVPTLGPAAWTAEDPKKMSIMNGRNPFQAEYNNLAAEAVTRGVGGMSTHWTCATPEFLKGLERPVIFTNTTQDDEEWKLLYKSAKSLIGTSETEFNRSIRHNVVLEALQKAYPNRDVKALPLACHRLSTDSPYVQWHAANDIYGDIFDEQDKQSKGKVKRGYFKLLTNTRCTRFELDTSAPKGYKVGLVEVQDLLAARLVPSPEIDFYIKAKAYVVAAGAVANPQILANSGFGAIDDDQDNIIPNLIDGITEPGRPQWWQDAVANHESSFGKVDPLPM